jgi:hypothetical protein
MKWWDQYFMYYVVFMMGMVCGAVIARITNDVEPPVYEEIRIKIERH